MGQLMVKRTYSPDLQSSPQLEQSHWRTAAPRPCSEVEGLACDGLTVEVTQPTKAPGWAGHVPTLEHSCLRWCWWQSAVEHWSLSLGSQHNHFQRLHSQHITVSIIWIQTGWVDLTISRDTVVKLLEVLVNNQNRPRWSWSITGFRSKWHAGGPAEAKVDTHHTCYRQTLQSNEWC